MNSSFLRDLAREELQLSVRGNCMDAKIPDGSKIVIRKTRWPLPGDIVVIATHERLLVHRLIGGYRRKGAFKVMTQADRAKRPDAAVPVNAMLGKVIVVDDKPVAVSLPTRMVSLGRFIGFLTRRFLQFS